MRARGQAIDGDFDGDFLGSVAIEGDGGHQAWDIRLSFEALVTLGISMNTSISVGLRQACLRLATQRLEERLRGGEIRPEDGSADTLWLMTEDVDEIRDLLSTKICAYQEFVGPDLYCAAADPSDPTAVGPISGEPSFFSPPASSGRP